MRGWGALLGIGCATAMLGGCAISLHDGRTQAAAPKPISAVYSQFNLKLRMLMAGNMARRDEECSGPECFDQRVAELGPKIAQAAYEVYPELACQVKSFEFIIADKREPATLSNSVGRVVVFRAVENVAYTDSALAFILAREVGHIVGQHHDENTAYGLFISGIAQVLLPVTSLAKVFTEYFSGAGAAVTTSATVAANASVSATSMAGSQVAVDTQWRSQQDEADDIAMHILARIGVDAPRVRQSFGKAEPKPVNEWMARLQGSLERLANLPEYDHAEYFKTAARTDVKAPDCSSLEHKPETLILGMR